MSNNYPKEKSVTRYARKKNEFDVLVCKKRKVKMQYSLLFKSSLVVSSIILQLAWIINSIIRW